MYMYVYVCICMYMYVYVCICMYMYVCMYIYIYVCMHGWMYVCMYVCMHVCMYVCTYVCICMYMYVCVCMCMYVYVCICMYMYVYVCICMHMYVYVCICTYMYVCICTSIDTTCIHPHACRHTSLPCMRAQIHKLHKVVQVYIQTYTYMVQHRPTPPPPPSVTPPLYRDYRLNMPFHMFLGIAAGQTHVVIHVWSPCLEASCTGYLGFRVLGFRLANFQIAKLVGTTIPARAALPFPRWHQNVAPECGSKYSQRMRQSVALRSLPAAPLLQSRPTMALLESTRTFGNGSKQVDITDSSKSLTLECRIFT